MAAVQTAQGVERNAQNEDTLKAVRWAKARIAFNTMRERAAMNGFMTDAEIAAEIAAARVGE